MDNNAYIRSYIDKEISDYLNQKFSAYDINLFKSYSDTADTFIHSSLIKKVWDFITSQFISLRLKDVETTSLMEFISLLDISNGTGRLTSPAPDKIHVYSWSNDIYSHVISRAINDKQFTAGKYIPVFGDISQYFGGNFFNNNRKYNLVFACPDDNQTFYKGIDSSIELANSSPYNYYLTRGSQFLTEEGFIFLFILNKNISSVNLSIPLNRGIELKLAEHFTDDFASVMVFQKIKK